MKYDYYIVGAGLYGCLFAYLASRNGKKCLIVDRRDHIGGLCHSYRDNGIDVHKYGAHIFRTNNKEVWDFVNSITPFTPFVNSPLASYYGELYNLPLNMNTFHQLYGVRTPEEAARAIEKDIVSCDNPRNLEEHVLSKVGTKIYEKLFKEYTEKQWGKKCNELPASIVSRIPIRYRYDNNYYDAVYQGIPEAGYDVFFRKLVVGSDVLLGFEFNANKGDISKLGKVIFTGPIDEFLGYCLGRLDFRAVRFETERLDIDNYQGNAVVNYTDDKPYTRIIEHKHFMPHRKAKGTVITREYPEVAGPENIPCYPINDDRNTELYRAYKELADKECPNVSFCGRLGEYRYYSMDNIIEKLCKLRSSL